MLFRSETPAKGSVTTSLVCLSCPLSVFGRDFEVDLVCLPLVGMDVIMGMNWLEYNHVLINCFTKTVRFSSAEEDSGAESLSTKEMKQLEQDGVLMFSLLAYLSVENQAVIRKLTFIPTTFVFTPKASSKQKLMQKTQQHETRYAVKGSSRENSIFHSKTQISSTKSQI